MGCADVKNNKCLLLITTLLFVANFQSAKAIECYQCLGTDSEHPFQCNEFLQSDIDIRPEPCDNVYGAQYCIKHIGRFEVLGLDCYQCTSDSEWKCMDGDLVKESLQLRNCSHVFEARYCVKIIGRNGGFKMKFKKPDICVTCGIGTKRYCSSLDLGNYCNYVKQPGDSLEYRTCVFTCSGDGCNPASFTASPSKISLVIPSLLISYLIFSK